MSNASFYHGIFLLIICLDLFFVLAVPPRQRRAQSLLWPRSNLRNAARFGLTDNYPWSLTVRRPYSRRAPQQQQQSALRTSRYPDDAIFPTPYEAPQYNTLYGAINSRSSYGQPHYRSPAQSAASGWGGYQPSLYRPRWQEENYAGVPAFESSYATNGINRDNYVPRAQSPPVYGNLDAMISKERFISESPVEPRDVIRETAPSDFKLMADTFATATSVPDPVINEPAISVPSVTSSKINLSSNSNQFDLLPTHTKKSNDTITLHSIMVLEAAPVPVECTADVVTPEQIRKCSELTAPVTVRTSLVPARPPMTTKPSSSSFSSPELIQKLLLERILLSPPSHSAVTKTSTLPISTSASAAVERSTPSAFRTAAPAQNLSTAAVAAVSEIDRNKLALQLFINGRGRNRFQRPNIIMNNSTEIPTTTTVSPLIFNSSVLTKRAPSIFPIIPPPPSSSSTSSASSSLQIIHIGSDSNMTMTAILQALADRPQLLDLWTLPIVTIVRARADGVNTVLAVPTWLIRTIGRQKNQQRQQQEALWSHRNNNSDDEKKLSVITSVPMRSQITQLAERAAAAARAFPSRYLKKKLVKHADFYTYE